MDDASSLRTLDRDFLLRHAALAPSSHNTQPWRFRVDGRRIRLYADRTRSLPVNDPDGRELTISCGAALLNLRVAAAEAGVGVIVHPFPEPGAPDLLAAIDLSGDADARLAALFPGIAKRRTYRRRFQNRSVPAEILDSIADAAAAEGAWLELLAGEGARREAARLVRLGDAIQWVNPAWRRELAGWMHPRRRGDGLTVPSLVAPITRLVVRTFDMGSGVGTRNEQLAQTAPVLAVLGTDRDDAGAWIDAGQALQRALLEAVSHGLQASYLNQPIQVGALRPKLEARLSRGGFPQLLLRLGYPADDLPAAPRRPLDEIVE